MQDVAIRPLGESDVAVLVDAYPERSPENRHFGRSRKQGLGQVTELVAWEGDRPVGWVIVMPAGSPEETEQGRTLGCAEMGDLFVAESARGRGIGRALMEAAEDWARNHRESKLGLAVTMGNPHNDVARSLYERSGYKESEFGVFDDGYHYWDESGVRHWDGEPHRYLVKGLNASPATEEF